MLLEFRVKNFRSFRDEQVFSLVASKDKSFDNTHTLNSNLKTVPHLLRSAVIYGANASGKSNLIKALQYMRSTVLALRAGAKDRAFSMQPFQLDQTSAAQPTEFEVTFMIDGVRYQYGFARTVKRITHEYLLVYKTAKPQLWFDRLFDPDRNQDVYKFGPNFKDAQNLKTLWKDATRSSALFLSIAVNFNSEALKPVVDWFSERLMICNEHQPINRQLTTNMLDQEEGRRQVSEFLTSADTSIADIEVVTHKVTSQYLDVDMTEEVPKITGVKEEHVEQKELRFIHVTEQGRAIFDLADESNGTRTLFFLAAPILNILQGGKTLVVDELDTSLHTLLLRQLVRLFHNPEINTKGAQLIFTTHDTSLLDEPNLFRRDQIWLTEKNKNQASALVALVEFSPRKNEALERGYLIGRYGGVPFLKPGLGLKD